MEQNAINLKSIAIELICLGFQYPNYLEKISKNSFIGVQINRILIVIDVYDRNSSEVVQQYGVE